MSWILTPKARRIVAQLVSFVIALSALVAIVSATAPGIVSPPEWAVVFAGSMGGFLFVAWRTTREASIDFEPLSEEDGAEPSELLVAPPRALRMVANEHSRKLFPADYVPIEVTSSWWAKNPYCLAILRSRNGEYLGYFNCLPLTDSAIQRIEAGKEIELEISPDDILPPSEMRKANTLYFPAIAVKDAGTETGRMRAASMFASIPRYFEKFYGTDQRRLIAAAASASGEKILKSLGAVLVSPSESRKDGHNLYELSLNANLRQTVSKRARRRSHSVPVRVYDPTGALARARLEP